MSGVIRKLRRQSMKGIDLRGAKLIEGDDKIRERKCLEHIQQILEAFDCMLIPQLTLTPLGIQGRWGVKAKSREPSPIKVPGGSA